MMNLDTYKQEIFRRSAEKIKKRKKIRTRVLAICIPLVLCLSAVLLIPKNDPEKQSVYHRPELMEYEEESIFCSYVRAELYIDGETVIITDKLTVDKLFNIAGFTNADVTAGSAPVYGAVSENEAVTEAPDHWAEDDEEIYDGFADQDYPLFRLEENNTPYIFFYTDDGTGRLYALTPEQYDEILEVLE